MNRLWIFGDSYASDLVTRPEIMDSQWHRVVAGELGLETVYNSQNGTSLEWLYYRWREERPRMAAGDVAVVALTERARRWVVKDNLFYTMTGTMDPDVAAGRCTLDKREVEAVRSYFRYLYHDTYEEALLENWLYNAADLAKRGVKVIVLNCFVSLDEFIQGIAPQFPQIHIAQGYLYTITRNEHVPHLRKLWYAVEGRQNHLTPPNHRELAKRIVAHVQSGEPIDLNVGFHESLIHEGNMDSPELFVVPHRLQY